MNCHKTHVESVVSYKYFKGNCRQPYFLYVENGYDKSVLPKALSEIVKDSQVKDIDIAQFGPAGMAFFLNNHYVGAEIAFSEKEKEGGF